MNVLGTNKNPESLRKETDAMKETNKNFRTEKYNNQN